MRVIVCGGRDYSDYRVIRLVMEALDPEYVTVVHGGAQGADRIAADVAESEGMPVDEFPARWSEEGRAAGPLRNRRMLEAGADLVIAFPGGRGTADMVSAAREAGVPVLQVLP